MNTSPTTKPYLVNIDLMVSIDIPIEKTLDESRMNDLIRHAIIQRSTQESLLDWMMENIGEIRPDEPYQYVVTGTQTLATDPEAVAYEEGRQAWIQFEANNGKRAKGNPYEIGTVENVSWNRGFNVG